MTIETYVLHLTKVCNQDCLYCYEDNDGTTYSWTDIKHIIDNITKYNKGEFDIEFLGGEPTLAMDLIEKVIDYVDAHAFLLTTNGTIVSDRLIRLLKENEKLHWTASLDGHKFANMLRLFKEKNKNTSYRERKQTGNTYNAVISNFKKLKELGLGNQLACHMTTHHYNVGYIFDSIVKLYEEGFRSIGVGIVETTMHLEDGYYKRYVSEMKRVSDFIYAGGLSGLEVWELENLKPKTDVRHYIKDETGRTVGESYGRAQNDIVSHKVDNLNSMAVSSAISDKIYAIREAVYLYHQGRMR